MVVSWKPVGVGVAVMVVLHHQGDGVVGGAEVKVDCGGVAVAEGVGDAFMGSDVEDFAYGCGKGSVIRRWGDAELQAGARKGLR